MRLRARTTTAAEPTVISANSQKTAASAVILSFPPLPGLGRARGAARRRSQRAPCQAPAGLAGGGEGGASGAGVAEGAGGAGLGGAAAALGFTVRNLASFLAKWYR